MLDLIVVLLIAVLIGAALVVAGALDVIAALGGVVPGERSRLENVVLGVLLIAVLRHLMGERHREPQEPEDTPDRVPLESELPPE